MKRETILVRLCDDDLRSDNAGYGDDKRTLKTREICGLDFIFLDGAEWTASEGSMSCDRRSYLRATGFQLLA